MLNEKSPTKFTENDAREPISCQSVLCLLSHGFCSLAPALACPVSHLLSHVSCLTSPVSRLLSPFSCLTSPTSRLPCLSGRGGAREGETSTFTDHIVDNSWKNGRGDKCQMGC